MSFLTTFINVISPKSKFKNSKGKGKYLFLNKHLLEFYATCIKLFLHYKVPHHSLPALGRAGSEPRS